MKPTGDATKYLQLLELPASFSSLHFSFVLSEVNAVCYAFNSEKAHIKNVLFPKFNEINFYYAYNNMRIRIVT